MGVRSTTATASLALLLCVSLTSCTADEAPEQEEVDAALLELERAADALSVTILRPGAERAFARKGHPVDGSLSCTAVSAADPSAEPSEELAESDEDSVTAGEAEESPAEEDTAEDATGDTEEARGGRLEVLCTGQSRDGEEIRFEGRLLREALAGREEGDDSLRGEFTGLVGEDEVFTMDCFQCSPVSSEAPEDPEDTESPDAEESPADAD